MPEEIVNRVANSKLKTFNLEDHYPKGERILFDLKDWLYEGFVLREKEFRQAVKDHNWSVYQDNFVALTCSSDAIVPVWAFMLITAELEPYAKKVVLGNLTGLESSIYQEIINQLDVSEFQGLPVIVKGCSNKPVPDNAYIQIIQKLQPVVKSLMFGEACSSVPLYKKPKK
ncbi:DUF2480 family protein [Mesonia aquimarina]|uniref:DUF2480 family protein n=1 Tax=Mesonia aquimarina TaxID=1504967 RepID=UPI000EF61F67|nr:DUF2480 family protein [Mesonia aquimarina]